MARGFSLCMSMSLLIPMKTAVCVGDGQVRVEELEGGRRSQEVRLGHMSPPRPPPRPEPLTPPPKRGFRVKIMNMESTSFGKMRTFS